MINLLFAAAVTCSPPMVINKTNEWTEQDQKTLTYVTNEGCKRNYDNAPCLKIFSKIEEGAYAVICGKEKDGSVSN